MYFAPEVLPQLSQLSVILNVDIISQPYKQG